jgi:hypothetical protein
MGSTYSFAQMLECGAALGVCGFLVGRGAHGVWDTLMLLPRTTKESESGRTASSDAERSGRALASTRRSDRPGRPEDKKS